MEVKMSKGEKFYSLGSGWLSALSYGLSGSRPQFSYEDTDFKYPDLLAYIPELPARFGRFDVYSQVTFATAVLALADAGMLQREGKKKIGIVVGSLTGVYDNDLAYFASTGEANGAFTSPNLFSYTLPNVALGEIAVFFNLIGPTFCVGNDPLRPGFDVMPVALSLLASGQCSAILAGWVEVADKIKNRGVLPKGAALTVLTLETTNKVKAEYQFGPKFNFITLF
jgi:3-oxoacyl-(acyl-carrier-protein) synthase